MRWLPVAGMAVLSFTVYVACVYRKVQAAPVIIKKDLVKWESTGDSASSTRLIKDSEGHITSVENDAEINSFRFVADSVMLTEYSKAEGRQVYSFKGRRDKAGKLTSGIAIAAYDVHRPDTVLHQFEYDKNGYLVKEFRDYGPAGTYIITYEYKDGDAIKIYTWYNNELYNTKELLYYKEKNNLTGLEDFKFRKNINNLTGHTSRHLVKHITSMARNGKLNYAFNFEYETDEEGLPLKLITKRGKKISAVTTYFYASRI